MHPDKHCCNSLLGTSHEKSILSLNTLNLPIDTYNSISDNVFILELCELSLLPLGPSTPKLFP